jgi:hypothetical protein
MSNPFQRGSSSPGSIRRTFQARRQSRSPPQAGASSGFAFSSGPPPTVPLGATTGTSFGTFGSALSSSFGDRQEQKPPPSSSVPFSFSNASGDNSRVQEILRELKTSSYPFSTAWQTRPPRQSTAEDFFKPDIDYLNRVPTVRWDEATERLVTVPPQQSSSFSAFR